MLNISKEAAGDGAVLLKLEGDATIENVEQLHKVMLETLQEVDHLLIDCEQVTSCDFYVLQMLCSAHRSSVAWEKKLTFSGTPSPVVAEAIRSAGFLRDNACSLSTDVKECMWIGELCASTD